MGVCVFYMFMHRFVAGITWGCRRVLCRAAYGSSGTLLLGYERSFIEEAARLRASLMMLVRFPLRSGGCSGGGRRKFQAMSA